MSRHPRQKLKLLLLERILLERSDEEHPISTAALLDALEQQGVAAERKSLYDDMDTLSQVGLDVQSRKGRDGGWFIGERPFQLPELKLLVDAVQSCKFITQHKSNALIHKLESLASIYQAHQLQRQVYVAGRPKTMNESVYYTIDRLHAAISQQRSVSFRYFEYDVRKEKVFRRGGKRYHVSPYGLIWDDENYYLAGYDHDHDQLRHYRVDKMAELTVTSQPRQGDAQCNSFDTAAYGQKHFGMFSGREADIRLRCEDRMVGVILDRFGRDSILIPEVESGHFTVTVTVVVSPQFLGWLFGLGTGVELLSPGWAVEAFRDQLRQVEERYPS